MKKPAAASASKVLKRPASRQASASRGETLGGGASESDTKKAKTEIYWTKGEKTRHSASVRSRRADGKEYQVCQVWLFETSHVFFEILWYHKFKRLPTCTPTDLHPPPC